ncbi:MAG TPA: hypothetical protein VJR89_16500 [Polyangiales bacterium]|nr:hypothetical protein [Polyangiales bacterium]
MGFALLLYAGLDLTVTPGATPWYDADQLNVHMMSGDTWRISGGHMFIALSLALLFVELVRATRSNSASIMNHALSVVVFVAASLLFVTVKGYGNSTFFLFTAMSFLDFMAGFIITAATTRRDISFRGAED